MSEFINSYTKHFSYLNTSLIFDKANNELIDTFIEISSQNNENTLNQFLSQKDTITNLIKAYGLLDSKKKEEVQMSVVLNIIEFYKKTKSLESLCKIYITICKFYFKIFDSATTLLNKEIAKIISKFIVEHSELYFNKIGTV